MQHFRAVGCHIDQQGGEVEAPPGSVAAEPRPPRVRSSMAVRIMKFAAVGGLGTIVNMAALYVLHAWVRLPLAAATTFAVEIAVLHNYLLNDRWTFAAHSPSLRRFVKFNASMLAGLGINVLVVWALAHDGMHFLLANVFGIAAAFALNFLCSAGWVWGRRDR